jgi:hypothetical protein
MTRQVLLVWIQCLNSLDKVVKRVPFGTDSLPFLGHNWDRSTDIVANRIEQA